MEINKTENRIFGGFSNASVYGHSNSVVSNGRTYILLSYLEEPIGISKSGFIAENTYVLFSSETSFVSISWKVEYYLDTSPDPFHLLDDLDDKGIFVLTRKMMREIYCMDSLVKIKVTAIVNNVVEIPLEHEVQKVDSSLENIILRDKKKNSNVGRPSITKKMMVSYYGYFLDLKNNDPVFQQQGNMIKMNLIVSIIYYNLMRLEKNNETEKHWATYLNNGDNEFDYQSMSYGVAGMRPDLLAMYTGGNFTGETPYMLSLLTRNDNEDIEDYSERLFMHYESSAILDENDKLDLFNMIRFPKPCIKMCSIILENIKNSKPEWQNQTWNKFLSSEDNIKYISDIYINGPSASEVNLAQIPNDILKFMHSPYVEYLASVNMCQKVRAGYTVELISNEKDLLRKNAEDEFGDLNSTMINYDEKYGFVSEKPCLLINRWLYYMLKETHIGLENRGEDTDGNSFDNTYVLIVREYQWRENEIGCQQGTEPISPQENTYEYAQLWDTCYEGLETLPPIDEDNPLHIEYEILYAEIYYNLPLSEDPEGALEKLVERLKVLYRVELSQFCLERTPADVVPNRLNYLLLMVLRLEELIKKRGHVNFRNEIPTAELPQKYTEDLNGDLEPDFPLSSLYLFPMSASWALDQATKDSLPELYSNKRIYASPLRLEFKHDLPAPGDYLNRTEGEIVAPHNNINDIKDSIIELANNLAENLTFIIHVYGYADVSYAGTGDEKLYNLQLSERRAHWTAEKLITELAGVTQVQDIDWTGCGSDYAPEIPAINPIYKDVRVVIEPA